jgi:O-antigen ligase
MLKGTRALAHSRTERQVGSGFLMALVLLYPITFVPVGWFAGVPPIMSDSIRLDLLERNFFLPKLLVLGVFALLALLEARKYSWRNLWTALLGVHLLTVLGSAVLANDDLTFTLLGGSQRFDGVVYQITLVLLGVFVYQTFQREPDSIQRVLGALVVVGAVQSLLVIMQRVGFDPVGTGARWKAFIAPAGSIGHPGMVAGLLLPIALVALWMLLTARGWRWKAAPGLGLGLIALGLSVVSNRSALLGLGVALLIFNLHRRELQTLMLSGFLMVVVLFGRELIPAVNGINVPLGSTSTLETRRMIWPLSWQAVLNTSGQPLIGGGPDGFRLWLLRSAPVDTLVAMNAVELAWPENVRVSSAERVLSPGQPVRETQIQVQFDQFGGQKNKKEMYSIDLDRAHNLVLDRLVAYGGLNAFSWIVLYFFPIFYYLKTSFNDFRVKKKIFSQNDGIPFTLLAGLIGLSVYYVTWFPVMQVEPLHLILLAATWVSTTRRIDTSEQAHLF